MITSQLKNLMINKSILSKSSVSKIRESLTLFYSVNFVVILSALLQTLGLSVKKFVRV